MGAAQAPRGATCEAVADALFADALTFGLWAGIVARLAGAGFAALYPADRLDAKLACLAISGAAAAPAALAIVTNLAGATDCVGLAALGDALDAVGARECDAKKDQEKRKRSVTKHGAAPCIYRKDVGEIL